MPSVMLFPNHVADRILIKLFVLPGPLRTIASMMLLDVEIFGHTMAPEIGNDSTEG